VSDVLAANSKIYQLRVDSVYNKSIKALQKKNNRYENVEQKKDNAIDVAEKEEEEFDKLGNIFFVINKR
jgi:hypothetical protein